MAHGRESPCDAEDTEDSMGLIPEPGRSPGGGHGSPLQCSCLENPVDRGAWRAAVHAVEQSDTAEVAERACVRFIGFSAILTLPTLSFPSVCAQAQALCLMSYLFTTLLSLSQASFLFYSSLISSIFLSVASAPAPEGRLFTFCLLVSFGHFSGAFPSLQPRLIHLSGTPVYFSLSPSAHPPSPEHQPNGSSLKNSFC